MSPETADPAAAINDAPACRNCRFWRTEPEGAASPIYAECHRRPPRIVDALLPSRREEDDASGAVFMASWFPATEEHDWCGEHQAVPMQAGGEARA